MSFIRNLFARAEISKNKINIMLDGKEDKTQSESSLDKDSFVKPYNPDDLYTKTGDYSLYEDMEHDDQVSVALNLKKSLVLGSGWSLESQSEDDEEIRLDLEKSLREDSDCPLEEYLEEILSAYLYGFSLSEKQFRIKDDGKLALKAIKTRHPASWLLHTDKYGNMERYEQHGISESTDVDPNYLIHYINNPRFQNPYGISDLRPAYTAWFVKREITKYYAIFLEKAASPIPVAKYDKAASKQAVTDVYNTIKKFQTKTAMVIPEEFEIEFLESKSDGDAFIRGINLFNMFIGRALLIPDLLGFQGSETSGGSFSLGKNQMDVFFKHINRRKRILENIINKEVIKPIVLFNHGNTDSMPLFKLNPVSEENIIESAKLWIEAVKGNVYRATPEEINHFRNLVKFPQQEQEDMEISPIDDEKEDKKSPISDEKTEGQDEQAAKEEKDDETEVAELGKKKEQFQFDRDKFHERVDFAKIEKDLNKSTSQIIKGSKPLVDEVFNDLIAQIKRKKIVEKQDVTKIKELKIRKTVPIRSLLNSQLSELYKENKKRAAKEVDKKVFADPLPDDKFLEAVKAENFNYVGEDWEHNVSKNARVALIAAVKDGKAFSEVVDILNNEGKKSALVSLERYGRTKSTEVLNKGRLAYFNQAPSVVGYQYSAILDDRTTTICQGLHGKQFVKGTEPVPPMHFNCRSVLIPINRFEEFEPEGKGINDFIDKEKGVGFPAK